MTLDEMWERLVQHQPFADANGYGPEWARMCAARTKDAAYAAYAAADMRAQLVESAAAGISAAIYWIEKAEGKN